MWTSRLLLIFNPDKNYFVSYFLILLPVSFSGVNDFDYPNLSAPSVGLSGMEIIKFLKMIPLPAELVEQFDHMQCSCMMGLFPEIRRAWLTVDSDIFVWNYEDGYGNH